MAEGFLNLLRPYYLQILVHELSIEGSRFARRNFGWSGIAKRVLTIFDRIHRVRQREEILIP